jgi:hypothetical protein
MAVVVTTAALPYGKKSRASPTKTRHDHSYEVSGMAHHAGAPIVLTAPLTEIIDDAGFFIQMSLAAQGGHHASGTSRAGALARPLPRVRRDRLLAAVRPDWREAVADARASTSAARARVLRMTVV